MKRWPLTTVHWPLLLFLLASPLYAQATHPIDDVRANSRSHVGPFYITPGLTLRDLGVDSNVFNEAEDPKSDFTFTLGPKADIAVPFARRLLLKSTVGVDLIYYQKYSDERSANPRFAPRLSLFLNRITLFGEGSYLRTRDRPSYEIDARSLRTESWLGGGIGLQFSPKLGIEVSGRRSDVEYAEGESFLDVSLREALNRRSESLAGAVKYAVTPLTTFVVKADRSQDRFEFSEDRDTDTLRVTPGVEFNTRALISGSAYVGVRRFNTKSDALDDFNGLVASAALAYTLLGRTTFIFTAERDAMYSFEPLQPYYVVDSYGLTIRHRFAGRFDVTTGAGRHQYTYRDLATPAGTVPPGTTPSPATRLAGERVDLTHSYSISLGYYLRRDLRLGFGTTYWQRESNSAAYRDYDALRTGVSLTYGF